MIKHFRTAIQRIRRSPYQTTAAVSIMTMTLFLASVFTMIAAGSEAILKYFEAKPQINAYFKYDYVPSPQEVDTIISQLKQTDTVDTIQYISKDDALKIYKDNNQSDPLLLEAVNANMLPASIEVSATDPKDLRLLSDVLKKQTNIDDVRFAEDIVANLTKWTQSVRIVGIALVGAHVFITFMVILLIIGLKVSSRKDEIGIFQLVGATRGYITAPFIFEGVIYGIVGAILAWGTSVIVLLYSMPFLVTFLAGIPILPPPTLFMVGLLATEIFLGIAVGGTGGLIAMRRFLKS